MNFYNGLIRHVQYNFIIQVVDLIIKSKVREETKPDEWLRIVSFMHERGWLYYGYEENKLVTVLGAYRVKKFDEDAEEQMPNKEDGNIVYVPFAASISKDKMIIRRITSEYIDKHPDVEEIIFKDHAKDKFMRIQLKGELDGRAKEAEFTGRTSAV